ncbi:hypothetical protein JQ604_32795 [Bradyrhizobium jicamae]|uniref:IPT/TIG domain-containing protein n=1 Tax=Bradyrhizobium jicamae TaxID=280332 RepID=UPI001BA6CBC3|nr:IPT/TIG domain-containing protein [Bradyrhizobium jicamae]MBR0756985.1 hypothetical protein [Bradyrhizobium jicamae]
MSETSTAPEPAKPAPVLDPAPPRVILIMGLWLLFFAALFLYLLIATWPVLEFNNTAFRPVNIFGFSHSWAPERHMMFTVMMAGAIGGLTHTLASFSDYVGNRRLGLSWIWFMVLRIPVGIAVALLFYFVIRGGILIPTVQVHPEPNEMQTALKINPYAIAGFSALAGMFSKQATDKLASVFDIVFAMKEPVKRADKLGANKPQPVITATDPKQLTVGSATPLTVNGSGFQPGCGVTVNGGERKPSGVTADKLVVPIFAGDVASAGELKIVVKNADDSASPEFVVKVA